MNDDVYFSSETMWYMNQIWFFVSSVFCRKQLILMINSLVVVCWPQPPPSPKPQPISDGMLRFKTENRKILIKLSNLLLFFWVRLSLDFHSVLIYDIKLMSQLSLPLQNENFFPPIHFSASRMFVHFVGSN